MFYQPHSLEEALELKRQHGTEAAFLAGGTDVIVMLNHGRLVSRAFIDLTHLQEFQRVTQDEGTCRADGGATFAQIGKLPITAISQAALGVGGPQIRNRGTIAGNLATASPAGDGSTALLALDANLELTSTSGSRTIPLRQFFLDYRKTALQPEEMITGVQFPADWRTGWHKLGKRGAMNISVVCCAVGVSPAGRFHVAFGSVGPYPLFCPNTEAYLNENAGAAIAQSGKSAAAFRDQPVSIDSKVIDEAARLAAEEVRPIDDFRAGADYRRAMSGALLKKVLRQVAGAPEPVHFSG